jgi:hypothetical protein
MSAAVALAIDLGAPADLILMAAHWVGIALSLAGYVLPVVAVVIVLRGAKS